jgi:serine protease Do
VILRFDSKTVNSSEDLPRIVGGTKPGAKTTVQVWRNKAGRDLQITVAELQEDRARQSRRSGKPPAVAPTQFGLTLSELTDARRNELKLDGGIVVENAQGAAARAGIRRGDIILSVNNQLVSSVEQFVQLMGQFEKGSIVALRVRRGGNSLYVPFQIDAR